jgi:biotin transporter BioY
LALCLCNFIKKYTIIKQHIWEKTSTYLILIGVCIGILLLELLGITILDKMGKDEIINDSFAEGIIFFICIPGILVGIIGAIICAVRKK